MVLSIRHPFLSPRRLIILLAVALLITACQPGAATALGPTTSSAYPISSYPSPGPTVPYPPTSNRGKHLYQNPQLKMAFRYPESWTLTEETPAYAYYEGPDGFFRAIADAGAGRTLDELAQMGAGQSQNPFGSSPAIEVRQAGRQEARSITPSADQPQLDQKNPGWGELIVAYPRPVLIDGSLADTLYLQADMQHLDEIAETLTFDEAGQAGERFPPVSDTPAAGICAEPAVSTVSVGISLDVPSPRCVKLGPQQMISVANQTGEPLVVRLAWYEIPLEAGEERSLLVPLGKYLAPGVHRLEIVDGSGNGPEIWITDPETADNIQAQTVAAAPVHGAPFFSPDGLTLAVPTARESLCKPLISSRCRRLWMPAKALDM
jgi:hypothetical protein